MIELKVAKPCPQAWEEMVGDDQVRHCRACQKNVYNLVGMTEAEIEALIQRTEGRFCARIYQRADGAAMTKDCLRGVAQVRRRMAYRLATVGAVVLYGVAFARRHPMGPAEFQRTQEKLEACFVPPPVMGDAIAQPSIKELVNLKSKGERAGRPRHGG